jgi:3-hydroxybutyryl-CoA dehydrogenase
VVGAGTMGAGIAQLGVGAGIRTLLHDPIPEALERGLEQARKGLAKWADRGRGVDASLLEPASSLDDLASAELVIEAAPERLELKRELFERLSLVVGEDAVLATNTSSIPVTALASSAARPENVVGMHFFNPAPLLKLLEVIAGDQTSERALDLARATGAAMGKRVILASDGPGFLVNRCGRPFYTEALRLLQERVASHDQIDRICRLGGGFRMGPFELMDLVGIDTGFEVAKSFEALSFGEPRWRPNPIQARLVAAGRLGRKAGRGYYDYSQEPYRPEDPEPPEPGGGDGRVVAIDGDGPVADGLRERARAAGYDVRTPDALGSDRPELLVDAAVPAPASDLGLATGGPPLLAVCADTSLVERGQPEACGFNVVPPVAESKLAEVTRLPTTLYETAEAADSFLISLGFHTERVEDAPALVLGRIVSQLVNEAAFAVGEGVGSAEDVDAGLTLGLNHPRGAVEWGEAIGLEAVLATIDGLYGERHEERYRAAPLLRRAAGLDTGLTD